MGSLINLILGVISIIMIITFFVMAARLKKIENILDILKQIELKKPENQRQLKCKKCGKEFFVGVLKHGIVSCPDCKTTESISNGNSEPALNSFK